ncbi:hypothetical protein MUO14_17525 [Halobacillus shinanisalinarum]|uniref:beta-N-acetylhexosaminidase n=1 Tax=Halobacillus shinanisalinarum TaxID=2932258 RepID=A0ABY4GWA0_9BACI|nr:glycoside hydrolase family 3 N-terminal domain-containing protein [Halobacillus shinanisalinarum]UOQ92266.1 hypothetical protein MUO14_17525 [Halobacillus shinanisalinarum]
MKKLVTKVCCLMVFLLVVASPSAAFTKSQSSEEHFKHSDPPSDKANKGMARRIIAHMTMKEKIGQLVMPVTHPQHAIDEMPNDNTREIIQDYHAGSVIIANKKDPEFMSKYNNQLQEWASETRLGIPLIISADLEYGTTHNVIQGTTTFPHQMGIGATRSTKVAETVASITAEEAKAMGFSWNFSPLADVNTNPKNPVIGVRSFGEKSDLVSEMTSAMIKGYQSEGVITSVKHFPGHGNTEVDSHFGLPTVTYDRETLKEVHLAPFKAAIDVGVDSIMTAHVIIEAIDPKLPATLSKKVLTGLLREEMNFDGIIITDAMSMDAIDERWGQGTPQSWL